jgi:hypothetical protein
MDEPRSVRFLGLLRALLRHGVDFFVVGGVAAQLEGAPILTFDLDVLYDKTPENLARLLAALRELKARYRDPAGRHIEPDAEKLATLRLHLLLTELGALDVLGSIGNGSLIKTSWAEPSCISLESHKCTSSSLRPSLRPRNKLIVIRIGPRCRFCGRRWR